MQILVTGGLGYIGSHTSVLLLEKGYDIVIVDDLSNSNIKVLENIYKITRKKPAFEKIDLKDKKAVSKLFSDYTFDGIIHFAAHKSVNESVNYPEKYFSNNVGSLENIIAEIKLLENPINFIFSSSCTVYGQADSMPINESFPLKKAESPYGESKKICEEILKKLNNSNHSFKNITLRYFNPIGAHPTGLIGELPIGTPQNLVPYITQTAVGKRDFLSVFGDNYKTKDGTCIRDYINIMDLAEVHIACLEKLIAVEDENFFKIYNVGTGKGTSVFELINLFENVNDIKLNYKIGDRRKGDVISAYADTTKIKEELSWSTKYSLENALKSAWNWELNLNKDE